METILGCASDGGIALDDESVARAEMVLRSEGRSAVPWCRRVVLVMRYKR